MPVCSSPEIVSPSEGFDGAVKIFVSELDSSFSERDYGVKITCSAKPDERVVLVHDGARPLATPALADSLESSWASAEPF